jgi:ribonuclease G
MMNRLMMIETPVDTHMLLWRNDQLIRFSNELINEPSQIGAILKGRILRVLPGLQAAFVDVGFSRPAFLQEKDLKPTRTQALMPGDEVIVEVLKDEMGDKGARLRERISLSSRAVAYSAFDEESRVSHRIQGEEHTRLMDLMQSLSKNYSGAFVARTNAENMSEADISHQAKQCVEKWEHILKKSQSVSAPAILIPAPNLIDKILREWPFELPLSILVNDSEKLSQVKESAAQWLPAGEFTCELLSDDEIGSHLYEYLIEKCSLFSNKIALSSGASLIVEQTALGWTIDINSGSNVGSKNIENSAWVINSEACQAIVDLICLRELSGTLVIDFIHMEDPAKWQQLKKNLITLLKKELTSVHVECVPSMGIVIISRRRERPDITSRNMKTCMACQGSGLQLKAFAMISRLFQMCYNLAQQGRTHVIFKIHPETHKQLQQYSHLITKPILEKCGVTLDLQADPYCKLDEVALT